MRGTDDQTGELFSYVVLGARVRADHPLRAIRGMVNEALSALEATRPLQVSECKRRPSRTRQTGRGGAEAGLRIT